MAQTEADPDADVTVAFTADVDLVQSLADGVNEVGYAEAVFEFAPDGLRVGCEDPAAAMMSEQLVPSDAFDTYTVDAPVDFGMDTGKVDQLLSVAHTDDTVRFDLDTQRGTADVRFGDVEYELRGIDTDNVNGRLTDIPEYDDPEYPYDVYATIPCDALERAATIVDLADYNENTAFFACGPDTFVIGGDGDLDESRVSIHEHEDFGWARDPPDGIRHARYENDYLGTIPDLCDDVVFTVTGEDLPVFFEQTRADHIDTTFAIAPRIERQ